MVGIFVGFCIRKLTPYAADAIAPLIPHSPFMNWLGVFGVREAKIVGGIELITAALLIIGSTIPPANTKNDELPIRMRPTEQLPPDFSAYPSPVVSSVRLENSDIIKLESYITDHRKGAAAAPSIQR